MGTELVHVPEPAPPPARPAPGPSIDLMGVILTGLKPQSAEGYLKDFEAFASFVGAPDVEAALWRLFNQPDPIANAAALAFHAEMAARGLTPATIARRLAALRRAVRRARLVGLTTLHLEAERPRAEAFRDCSGPGKRGWEAMLELAERLAAAGRPIDVRNLAVLLLLHDRALRRGELVAIDLPGDVDLGRPAVAIVGKGKTSREWLTINERCRAALARWIEARGDAPGPLFTRADNAAGDDPGRMTGASVNRMVKTLAGRAGLTRAVRAHGLRHQAITEALDGGWDVRDVKAFSRHGKIDTVLIYDDRRKDVGGEISRGLGRRDGRRRGARK